MPEFKNYLIVELPGGGIRLEGPFETADALRRAEEINLEEKRRTTVILAGSLGLAILKASNRSNNPDH